MATKLRQKKKRSGTGGEAEEGRRIEEEGESWGKDLEEDRKVEERGEEK